MGIDIDQELSPSLQEKLVFVGVLLKSFPQAAGAIWKLLEVTFGRERLERLTEPIGRERVEQRVGEVQAVVQITLMDKVQGPAGVTPPVACAVMGDGGRWQKTAAQPDSQKHWYEYKAGLCLELGNLTDANDPTPPGGDPCPQVPEFLVNFEQVEMLTRELAQRAASIRNFFDDQSQPHQRDPLAPRIEPPPPAGPIGDCLRVSLHGPICCPHMGAFSQVKI